MHLQFTRRLSLTILFWCLFSVIATAKDLSKLELYLRSHQIALHFDTDSTLVLSDSLTALLNDRMKGKTLLVAADGGSHYLQLNGHINHLMLRYLAKGNLQYYFMEGARSWAMKDNNFLEASGTTADVYYRGFSKFTRTQAQLQKEVYKRHPFQYVGIDFERGRGLYEALQTIVLPLNATHSIQLATLAPYITDTAYLKMSAAAFKKFYGNIQHDFYRDSSQLKELLGSGYAAFAYLLTNQNINTPYGNRDLPMAENLLRELAAARHDAVHLVNCGMAHSRPNIKGTMVHILSQSPELKDRILVANLVCYNCVIPEETVSNWAFSFAKGEVMETLYKSASANIVLYDLSALPEEFASIRAYGDLLIFAQGVQ